MFGSCLEQRVDRRPEARPFALEGGEHRLAFGRQRVVAAGWPGRRLAPRRLHEAVAAQASEQGIAAHGPSSISREFLQKVENRHIRLT
jgi:hypothetical protein